MKGISERGSMGKLYMKTDKKGSSLVKVHFAKVYSYNVIIMKKYEVIVMFTYDEKKYMLSLLKKERKLFGKNSEVNSRLIEKLEQMIRNEEVNSKDLRNNKL